MIAGVDGCKAGWLVAVANDWPADDPVQLILCDTFLTVIRVTKDCRLTVVDMPIGLPDCEEASPFPRECDTAAKRQLGSKASSVFYAPPRQCLTAATPKQFQLIHRKLTGRGAGLPVWGIVPKIKEVDDVITAELQKRIFEFHPELAWQRANRGASLEKKKSALGLQQRRKILSAAIDDLPKLEQWTKKVGRGAAIDDLFDALIGIKAAAERSKQTLIPLKAKIDSRGLKMQYAT